MTEDRYVAAMEIKDISGVGGPFIFHHAIITSTNAQGRPNGSRPIHGMGRNAAGLRNKPRRFAGYRARVL